MRNILYLTIIHMLVNQKGINQSDILNSLRKQQQLEQLAKKQMLKSSVIKTVPDLQNLQNYIVSPDEIPKLNKQPGESNAEYNARLEEFKAENQSKFSRYYEQQKEILRKNLSQVIGTQRQINEFMMNEEIMQPENIYFINRFWARLKKQLSDNFSSITLEEFKEFVLNFIKVASKSGVKDRDKELSNIGIKSKVNDFKNILDMIQSAELPSPEIFTSITPTGPTTSAGYVKPASTVVSSSIGVSPAILTTKTKAPTGADLPITKYKVTDSVTHIIKDTPETVFDKIKEFLEPVFKEDLLNKVGKGLGVDGAEIENFFNFMIERNVNSYFGMELPLLPEFATTDMTDEKKKFINETAEFFKDRVSYFIQSYNVTGAYPSPMKEETPSDETMAKREEGFVEAPPTKREPTAEEADASMREKEAGTMEERKLDAEAKALTELGVEDDDAKPSLDMFGPTPVATATLVRETRDLERYSEELRNKPYELDEIKKAIISEKKKTNKVLENDAVHMFKQSYKEKDLDKNKPLKDILTQLEKKLSEKEYKQLTNNTSYNLLVEHLAGPIQEYKNELLKSKGMTREDVDAVTRPIFGVGLKKKKLKPALFGRYLLDINKLENEGLLQVFHQSGNNVKYFRTIAVSNLVKDIIFKLLSNNKFDYNLYNRLDSNEKDLMKRLLEKSGLLKDLNLKLDKNKYDDIHKLYSDLKEQYMIISSQIEQGNDSPILEKQLNKITKDLKQVITHLSKLGEISKRDATNMILSL